MACSKPLDANQPNLEKQKEMEWDQVSLVGHGGPLAAEFELMALVVLL